MSLESDLHMPEKCQGHCAESTIEAFGLIQIKGPDTFNSGGNAPAWIAGAFWTFVRYRTWHEVFREACGAFSPTKRLVVYKSAN